MHNRRPECMISRAILLLLVVPLASACSTAPYIPPAWPAPAPGGAQLRTRLLLIRENPRLGKPILVRLELRNDGPTPVRYTSWEAGCNHSLEITGPDGKSVRYIGGPHGGFGNPHPISPGESNFLIPFMDLREQYLFDRPGQYTLRYLGRGIRMEDPQVPIAPCRLGIDVAPGDLDPNTAIASRLASVVPEPLWFAILGDLKESYLEAGAGLEGEMVFSVAIRIAKSIYKDEELLGSSPWGLVYASTKNKDEVWPGWRKAILSALEVKN
jgi:hypothetical protein